MRNMFFVLLFGALFALIPLAQAQEQPKPLIYLGEYKVKPDKTNEFESVIKDFIKEMKKYDMPYTFHMYSTNLFTYYSVNEFENYSMLDKFNADWGEVEKKIGAETIDRYHEVEFGAIDSFKGTLLRYRPNQSFLTENIRWNKDEDGFVHWVLCYIDPSKRQEWISLQKKWVEFYKYTNIKRSFFTFTGDIGYEMPVWIYVRTGGNQTEYFSELKKINTVLGEKRGMLLKQNLPLIKRAEERFTIYRPDLSYIPKR